MAELLRNILLFLLGFGLLVGGAEFLVRGASRLAARFRVSPVVIGLTVVAIGTSLPELLVTVLANMRPDGAGTLAIGNIVGSNIANLGLILGVASALAVLMVEPHLLRREFPILLGVSVAFTVMAWNGAIGRVEGAILVAGAAGFLYNSYTAARTAPQEIEHSLEVVESLDREIAQPSTQPLFDLALIGVGSASLVVGANWLVDAAQFIARAAGVSELVIGLTLVAIGTSLPEMVTTVMAVLRRETDIAVGNVVGSNIMNMLLIGGLSAAIKPLPAPVHMRTLDFPMMLGLTALIHVFALARPHRLDRWKGAVLLAVYVGYAVWLFVANSAGG